jgi:cytochrome c-type biogenesis protein CcmH
VLFVFANAEQGPPMPLAVQRLPGQTLPAEIHLDDSMAMARALRLSAFNRYIVTVRLSGGGGAQAQSGDLGAACMWRAPRPASRCSCASIGARLEHGLHLQEEMNYGY